MERGYEESEVIESVIRAICPGMPLRSYLESTPDLNLARLRQILRSHFREGNATDLYQQLAALTQLHTKRRCTVILNESTRATPEDHICL